MKRHFLLISFLLLFIVVIAGYFLSSDIQAIYIRATKLDSIGHIIGFFLLSWLLCSVGRFPLINIIITLSIYAGLTELAQLYLGFRNGELSDFFADLVGIGFFAVIKWGATLYRRQQRI
ncbi:VanZ family protein [Thalassotalea ganghwensis]